jgi:competence protein ComEA
MDWKTWFNDYLHFSRKDRIAVMILVMMIIFVVLIPEFVIREQSQLPYPADSSVLAALREISDTTDETDWNEPDRFVKYQQTASNTPVNLFYFDPNQNSYNDWRKLGVPERTIKTILKYVSKGGKFRSVDDLRKIYGLNNHDYERIAPYCRISPAFERRESYNQNPTLKKPVIKKELLVDINAADSSAFVELPGIGNKLASRIIHFREKLGGFYSIGQIAETFGLPDSTFQSIKKYLELKTPLFRLININKANFDELKNHPYLRGSLAKAILAYRDEHGPFSRPDDLKRVMAITEEVYQKIIHYIQIE